jgi:hypothetical protein
MGFIHLQIEWNPQIPVLSALYPQLNFLTPPKKNSWVHHCIIVNDVLDCGRKEAVMAYNKVLF